MIMTKLYSNIHLVHAEFLGHFITSLCAYTHSQGGLGGMELLSKSMGAL